MLCLSVTLGESSQGAQVPLETGQLGTMSRAWFSIAAATSLPQTGPQGQQEVTDQELHTLTEETEKNLRAAQCFDQRRGGENLDSRKHPKTTSPTKLADMSCEVMVCVCVCV